MSTSKEVEATVRSEDPLEGAVRSRWPRVLAALIGGALLSGLLFHGLERAEADRVELDFRRDAADRISAFQVAVIHGLDALVALDAFYDATPEVERAAFRAFTSDHLLEEPGVAFLGWAPRVSAAELTEFEASIRAQSDERPDIAAALGRFRVFEVGSNEAQPVTPRPEYFPVLFAEPDNLAQRTLGFDVASDPVQGEAMERARKAHRMVASGRDPLSPGADRFGVAVFNPVFGRADSDDGVEGASEQLLGVIFGMFEIGEILGHGMENLEPRGIDVAIHDLTASREESLLHFHQSRLGSDRTIPWTIDEALEPIGLVHAETVPVGDRNWLISGRPAAGYVDARQTWTPVIGLIGGLLLTGIVAGTFFTILGRESEARQQANDLLSAKRRLEKEVELRERARVRLAASEERFRRVFDGAPVGIGTADLEGRFLEANPALCRMLRCEESELLETTITEFVHPDDQEAEREHFASLVRGEAESVQYSERLRPRDGNEIWAELNISLLRDESGQPLYYVGLLQDITERRQASERLRQARETQERILDSLPLNVFLKDRKGRIQFINARGLDFLRRERSAVVGKTDAEIFPARVAENLRRADRRALESDRPVTQEETLEVDGETFHFLSGKTTIEVEGSDEPHLLGFSIDLTPIKKAEEALARSEFRFRKLVENMSSGVAVYEVVDDGADFVFRDYNRAAERMDGISREEVIGKRLTEAFPGAEEMGLLELFAGVWRTGEARSMPITQYQDARLEGWRENYAYRLPSGEIVAIYDDVTDRKRLEAELLHAQKMEAIGRLAGGVAHDFNNLLQVVAGNAELLLRGSFADADREKMLSEIREQVKRGTKLVRRLLAFSRRESYAPTKIDLGEVLRGAETLVRRLVKENIKLVMELADAPLPAAGDASQIEQVLMNLVVNASDAMPSGGRLEIRSGEEGSEVVWFSVSDTGPGIPEEDLENVFDPYFTTKSAGQGTGLGLAVVHGIVSVHGGRIEVDSQRSEGVRFKVILPRNEEELETPQAEAGPKRQVAGPGEQVLVVEDQDLVRRTVEAMLTSIGYSVTTAADGAAARKLFSAQEFDLLVSDIVLPDTTGVELAHEFRARRRDLAVLLVSGYAEEAVREQGAELRFLRKPFRLEDLAQQVAAALHERPGRQA